MGFAALAFPVAPLQEPRTKTKSGDIKNINGKTIGSRLATNERKVLVLRVTSVVSGVAVSWSVSPLT